MACPVFVACSKKVRFPWHAVETRGVNASPLSNLSCLSCSSSLSLHGMEWVALFNCALLHQRETGEDDEPWRESTRYTARDRGEREIEIERERERERQRER